jgi:type 1 glutamine amidotransferase
MTSVLLLTGGPPHAHDFPATAAALNGVLAAEGHDVAVVDDPDDAATRLSAVAVLAVNALRWRMLDDRYAEWRDEWAYSPSPATRAAITAFVDGGGGLLAIHTASICFDDWPEWGDIVGAAWRWGVSSHPPYGAVAVDVLGEHPVVAGLPPTFHLDDEVYGDLDRRGDLDVLAVARPAAGGDEQPVVWSRRFGAGRVVYDALGHDADSVRAPEHARLLAQSVRWLAGSE